MGPHASSYLYSLLIKKAIEQYGVTDNDQFPKILLFSIPVPDFISNIKNQEIAFKMLLEIVKDLKRNKVSTIAIACNTAHLLLRDLQKNTEIPFTSMIDLVCNVAKAEHHYTVGVLASPITIKSRLYQISLSKRGLKSLTPNNKQLKVLESIIRHVVAGKVIPQDCKKLVEIADYLRKKGATGIILGCTELPLIFPGHYPLSTYNSLEVLADTLLNKYYNEKFERR